MEPWEKMLVATVLIAMTVMVCGLAVKLPEVVEGVGRLAGNLGPER